MHAHTWKPILHARILSSKSSPIPGCPAHEKWRWYMPISRNLARGRMNGLRFTCKTQSFRSMCVRSDAEARLALRAAAMMTKNPQMGFRQLPCPERLIGMVARLANYEALSLCLSVSLYVSVSVSLPLSFCVCVCVSLSLSLSLSVCLSLSLSIYIYMYICIYVSVSFSLSPCTYS